MLKPVRRSKPGVPQRRAGGWPTRLSDLRTERDLEFEARRENLRDQRWRRHQSMILTLCEVARNTVFPFYKVMAGTVVALYAMTLTGQISIEWAVRLALSIF